MSVRKNTSVLWHHFEKSMNRKAICNICKDALSFKSTTTNLKAHLRRKHFSVFKSIDKDLQNEHRQSVCKSTKKQENDLLVTNDNEPVLSTDVFSAEPPDEERAELTTTDMETSTTLQSPLETLYIPQANIAAQVNTRSDSDESALLKEAISTMKYLKESKEIKTPVVTKRDENDIFGELVAFELKKIVNPAARAVAKLNIHQILCDAQIGQYNQYGSIHSFDKQSRQSPSSSTFLSKFPSPSSSSSSLPYAATKHVSSFNQHHLPGDISTNQSRTLDYTENFSE